MMNHGHQQQGDMYYDQSHARSPIMSRLQQPTSQHPPSRPFDVYGQMPTAMYGNDEQSARYEPNRFDRMNNSLAGGYDYNVPTNQTWNPGAFGGVNSFNAFGGATARLKPTARGRTGLPNASRSVIRHGATWLDQQQAPMGAMNAYGGIGPSPLGPQIRQDNYMNDPDEELIPTAIVIKNIPFAVKKEQLVDLMSQMNLPLPYAFNYHFDNGVFRGLAFANFTSADETAMVIDNLNHFELQGRKLRVEYKKMLPLQERERIEREKRERRGQLEEQHRPMNTPQLHGKPSMSSVSSHVPATSPSPGPIHGLQPDLNDPQTLQFYSELLLFQRDKDREALIFPSNLSPQQRRIVHTLAHHMQLGHLSRGNGDQRQVHVFRPQEGQNISPPIPQVSVMGGDSRRVLNRAATMDFSEARGSDPGYGTLRGQQSTGFLGIPDSPGGFGSQQNPLRAAKSFADLRSYSPSPVPSSASHPPVLQSGMARFQNYGMTDGASATPTLTPTASGSALGQHRADEGLLVNGLGSMSLGGSSSLVPNGGSPRRLRNVFSWDQQDSQTVNPPTGPIGSNRSFSGMNSAYDESRDRGQGTLPMRQPRGPAHERNFVRGRQNGHQQRGSDELRQSSSVEIIVE